MSYRRAANSYSDKRKFSKSASRFDGRNMGTARRGGYRM